MLTISNTEVLGFDHAIRGMRNPMNSHDKSDSYWTHICDDETLETANFQFFVGDADEKLMKQLAKSGSDHAKYLRMITVYFDVTAPMYWLKQFSTYAVGVVSNSTSTMHKIHAKEFTLDDFSHEHLNARGMNALVFTLQELNHFRLRYLESKEKSDWWQMIQLLPSSYNQTRTVMLNYEVLRRIYHSRRNHKLDEWHTFCEWIESLPHSDLITGEESGE